MSLVGLMPGPQDKKKSLDDFYEDLDVVFPEEATWRRRFQRTRDLVEDLFPDKQALRRWRGKTEFY